MSYDDWKTREPEWDDEPTCEHCGDYGHTICGSCEEELAEEIETMDLRTYAHRIRNHDWSAAMSDSYSVGRAGDARRRELAALAQLSPNHARLWELGSQHHGNFTWESWATDERDDALLAGKQVRTRAAVWETAWRWVASYLWAHGTRLSEEEAQALVGSVDGYREWYGRMISTARQVDWQIVDGFVELGDQLNESGFGPMEGGTQ